MRHNILITGANGLIGYELTKLLAEHQEVYALSRTNPGISGVNFLQLDLSGDWDSSSLPDKIDVIYHLAQSENFREFPDKAEDVFNVNTISTLKLLNYAIKSGCQKFIYASSGGVYGNSEVGFTEDSPLKPNSEIGFYLTTKFCSELLVENYVKWFDVITARFFFVYGKRQNKSMLIPRLVENIKQGNNITLQGNEGLKINPIHVQDASRALSKLIPLKGSHKINIGGRETLDLKKICEIIGDNLGTPPHFTVENITPKHLIGDITKMERLIGLPEIEFDRGIRELL